MTLHSACLGGLDAGQVRHDARSTGLHELRVYFTDETNDTKRSAGSGKRGDAC